MARGTGKAAPVAYWDHPEPTDTDYVEVPDFANTLIDAGYDHVSYMRFSQRGVEFVFAVQKSPDELSFAFARTMFGRPQLSLRSVLENGSVVETRTRPETRQEYVWLLRPWEHQPLVGYYLESRTASTRHSELQQRHNERLKVVCEREHTRLRPHAEIALALVVMNRAAQLRLVRLRVGVSVGLSINALLTVWGLLGNLPLLWVLSLVMLPFNVGYLGPGFARLLPVPGRIRTETLVGAAPPATHGEQVH